MSHEAEYDYLDLLGYIMESGEDRADRTGTGTRAIFAPAPLRIDLEDGFPILTTKTVPFKSVLSELLWFIEGSGDERRLAEILHGTRDPAKKTIWSPNAEGTTGSSFEQQHPGDLGRIYGVQWRKWRRYVPADEMLQNKPHYWEGQEVKTSGLIQGHAQVTHVDQLTQVIHKLKTNPTDRRIIMTAWNPGELDQMALPPCHMFVQFYLDNSNKLNAQMYQRSVDVALGLPFNIASYALLTHMIAHVVGAIPGILTMVLGDTHIYHDHFDGVKEQLTRTPSTLSPQLRIIRSVKDIDDFKMDDFQLDNYAPLAAIKMRMSA